MLHSKQFAPKETHSIKSSKNNSELKTTYKHNLKQQKFLLSDHLISAEYNYQKKKKIFTLGCGGQSGCKSFFFFLLFMTASSADTS